MGSVNHLFYSRMVRFYKKILQHVAEYCEQAAIHGPQHLVSERLTRYERLVINSNENSKVFEQKGDLLNFKANIDPMAVLSQAEPS